MPVFSPDTPTSKLKVLGSIVTVPMPYGVGHALTEGEARFMNRMLASVTGNGMGGDIRRALEAANKGLKKGETAKIAADLFPDLQSSFNARYAAYTPGESSRGGSAKPTGDPVGSLVHFLATAKIKEAIASKGLKVRDFQTAKVTVNGAEISKFSKLVGDYITAHPELKDQAEAQLAQSAASDDIDLGLEEVAKAA